MIIFLFVFIAGFLKSIADTIRVPAKFHSSIFKKWNGNKYIDPEASWLNKYILGDFMSVFIAPFSDVWHLCYTGMILLLFLCAPWYYNALPMYDLHIFWLHFITITMLYLCFGFGAETGFRLWKK
jgi:hypothetical protein